MCGNSETSNHNQKKYDTAVRVREFEIDLFWKRSLFFGGFIAAAGIGYSSAVEHNKVAFQLLLSCFGFVCSVAWSLANRGSKYWQENWEKKVSDIEDEITGPLFKIAEGIQKKGIWGAKRYSVSRLAIAVSDYLAIIWFCLTTYQTYKIINKYYIIVEAKDILLVLFSVLSIIYAMMLILKCKTKLP